MDPLVADVAVAEIPEPVPVVVDQVGMIRLLGAGPSQMLKSTSRGRGAAWLDADRAARFVAKRSRDQQLTQLPRLHGGRGHGPFLARPALRSVLDDPLIAACGLDGDPAFMNVVTARLLDVDVFPRLSGPDRHERVPVIGRRDRDHVDVLVLEDPANVLYGRWCTAAARLDLMDSLVEGPGVGIDQVSDRHSGHLHVLIDMGTRRGR